VSAGPKVRWGSLAVLEVLDEARRQLGVRYQAEEED
jgi:hypothetical protein